VMKGRHNSVISRLKQSQPHVQDLGCICHLAQLATGCGIRAAQIHRLEEMCRLIKRILGFLIPARAFVGVPLKEVEYGEGHQLADESPL
ncbi:hypothetical protein GOODEAATRI_029008, partial [Goodea atripinnis]